MNNQLSAQEVGCHFKYRNISSHNTTLPPLVFVLSVIDHWLQEFPEVSLGGQAVTLSVLKYAHATFGKALHLVYLSFSQMYSSTSEWLQSHWTYRKNDQ